MKDGSERVWLSGEVRAFLRRCREKSGVSVSGFIRDCVLRRLSDECGVDADLERFLLLSELAGLFEESASLRKSQNVILANFVYLRDYVRELVKGDFKNPAFVQVRRSILCYPGAEKALPALERLLGRRDQIGQRMCEVIAKLYPNTSYDQLGLFMDEYGSERTQRSRSLRSDKNKFGGGEKHDGQVA